MTYMNLSDTLKMPVGPAVDGFFAGLKERFATYRRYRHTLSELSALTPRELADLGIRPGDIRQLARESAAKS